MMRSFQRTSIYATMTALGLLGAASMVHANTISLSDQNAEFIVNILDEGVVSMTVDGINHVWSQDFLHDVTHSTGVTGKDKGQDVIGYAPVTRQEIGMVDPGITGGVWLQAPLVSQSAANQLTLTYTHTDVEISISFELIGGALASNSATIIETYEITNKNAYNGAISVNLFAFTDVDLGGSFFSRNDDMGELTGFDAFGNPNQYRQYDSNYQLIASTDIAPDAYWVAQGLGPNFEETCPNYMQINCVLYDMNDTLLPNTVLAGPADLQMAAQWIRTLGYNESFSYTHTMQLCPAGGCPDTSEIPLPAAAWLLGTGLLGLYGAARRRRVA